jgi:hypothetical protein
MSEAKVGLSATVWVEVVGLFTVVLDFVNAFGFVPLHVLKPAMRINVSINMLFGIGACYSRESAPAMPITSGVTRTKRGVPRSARRRARGHPVAAQRREKIVREIKQVYEGRPRRDKRGADPTLSWPLSSYRPFGAGLYPACFASCSVMYLPFLVVP